MSRRPEESACYVPVDICNGDDIILRQGFNPSGCGREMVVRVSFRNGRVTVLEVDTGRYILETSYNADAMGRAVWAAFRALADTRSISPLSFRKVFDDYFGGGAR